MLYNKNKKLVKISTLHSLSATEKINLQKHYFISTRRSDAKKAWFILNQASPITILYFIASLPATHYHSLPDSIHLCLKESSQFHTLSSFPIGARI